MGLFFKDLGFSGFAYVNSYGKAGGIWLVGIITKVSVNVTGVASQAINTVITKDGFEDWLFSTVYASLNPSLRENLWEDMEARAETIDQPWLVAGDLNDTMTSSKGRSFTADCNASQRRKFTDHVNNYRLIDMGSSGPKFTWNNGRQGLANVQKRLDRALCNEEWRALFPEGGVKLNTGGCFYESNKKAGIGGTFRDHKGSWILGYFGKANYSSSLEVEIWAIYRGLSIMLEKGMYNVNIESDSSVAVKLCNEGAPPDHAHRYISRRSQEDCRHD